MAERGFFGIGVVGSKTATNVGTLWRSAANFNAAFIFTAGRRFPQQASDTIKAWKHVPLLEVDAFHQLAIPRGCRIVGVEQVERSRPLARFSHPERALYVLGAEDSGLPSRVLDACHDVVEIDTPFCLNVAVAGSIVMYDRQVKRG